MPPLGPYKPLDDIRLEALPDNASWIAADNAVWGNVFHNNRSSRDNRAIPDHYARTYKYPMANPDVVSNDGKPAHDL